LARRVRDDRMRACVEPSIARHVPRINVGPPEVAAAGLDVERQSVELHLAFGHIGDGNLHVNTLKAEAMPREEFLERAHRADDDLFALVQAHQGSVSAEHGIGLLKKNTLHYTRTEREMELLRALKKAFDPHGLLNPGKIFD
jgi:FAD/FMN-containing dehydrogenase